MIRNRGFVRVPAQVFDHLFRAAERAGFEINGLNGWSSAGFSAMQMGGANGSANAESLGANGDRLYQTKAATAGKTHLIKAFSKSVAGAATATLAIKFMNSTFAPLSTQFTPIAATAVFAEFSVQKAAPAATVFVEISIIKETGAGILVFADFCLTDGVTTNFCSPDQTPPTISACLQNQI